MTEKKPPARPSQVTMAGWMIIIGSVVVVLTTFDVVAGMRTLETREAVEEFLAEPPGNGLGIGVETALQAMHVLAMVAAGCATAAAILGWHALKRSRSARLTLSVLAVPLFVSGIVAGGFMSSVVVVAALMLWLQPARDWFNGVARERLDLRPLATDPWSGRTSGQDQADVEAGRRLPPPQVSPTAPSAGEQPAGQTSAGQTPAGEPAAGEPRPWAGFGHQPSPGLAGPGLPVVGPAGSAPPDRPRTVTLACVLTWVFSGLVLALAMVSLLAVAFAPSTVLDELHRQDPQFAEQGLSDSLVIGTLIVSTVLMIVWSVAGIVLGALVARRIGWARIALIVSASIVAVFALLGSITSFVLIVPLVACTLTISLLLRRETRDWFASRPR